MSERLTDKKRGFLGEPGNLISNVDGLSLNRFMREELGGLFQTQVKRFTPDGNVTVKGFGMYEEVMSEPIARKEEITTANERLVVLSSNQTVSLIIISSSGYTVLHSVDISSLLMGGTAISASWNYDKERFIVFASGIWVWPGGGWGIFEITPGGVSTRVALYDQGSGWDDWIGVFTMRFLHSYGTTGANNLMWIGIYEWNQGFTHVFTLNNSYRFGRYITSPVTPDQYMLVNYSDCDAYFEPTTSGSELVWVTHDNVRIVRPLYYDAVYEAYWPKHLRSCEVGGKIANIFREIIPGEASNERESSIHLCSSSYLSVAALNESTGRKETPTSYLTGYSIIKNSERVIIPGTGTHWYENRYYDPSWWDASGFAWQITSIEMPVMYQGINRIEVHMSAVGVGGEFVYYFTYWGGDETRYVVQFYFFDPPLPYTQNSVIITDPGGVSKTFIFPDVTGFNWSGLLVCWVKEENAGGIVYEAYNEIAYVNKHYIVAATHPTTSVNKIFVADGNGAEKYTIPLATGISLNRVIIK